MSAIGEKLRQSIANIVKSTIKSSNLRSPKLCVVIGVSSDVGECMSCDVKTLDTGVLITDVRLTADNEHYGFVLIPSVGSKVEVSFNTETDTFLSMVSQVDGIYLNGNDNGGLIKIAELVSKINTLENTVNALITAYNAHQHTGVTTGSGTSGTTTVSDSTVLIPTVRSEIENKTVQHGTGTQI